MITQHSFANANLNGCGLCLQLDSLIGATVQRTRFVNATKRIWTEDAGALDPRADVKVISGLDLLTNNQVSPSLGRVSRSTEHDVGR